MRERGDSLVKKSLFLGDFDLFVFLKKREISCFYLNFFVGKNFWKNIFFFF